MKGYRKLIMFVLAAAIVAFIPLTPTNGGVLETLIIVGVGGNAIEHLGGLGGVIREKLAARRACSGGSCAGTDAGSPEDGPKKN